MLSGCSGEGKVAGQCCIRHSDQFGSTARSHENLAEPTAVGARPGFTKVHREAVGGSVVYRGENSGGQVVNVAPGPQQIGCADGDVPAMRAQPTQDRLFAALLVVRAVDHRQPQHHGAAVQPALLDVELLVVGRHLDRGTAMGVALSA